jgi:tetratricopeptide (TPR) repeat protein
MKVEGAAFTLIGALDAFPHRLAARAIAAQGGILRRGLSRRTDIAVVGHRLIAAAKPERILHRLHEARHLGTHLVSENSFLRLMGLAEEPNAQRQVAAASLRQQAGLSAEMLGLLALFDMFEFGEEPFGFRDLVAAKQCGRLIADGVDWVALVRAVRARVGDLPDGGLASLRLERSGNRDVLMREGEALMDMSGQHILALPGDTADGADRLFEEAKEAEDAGDWERARTLYTRCLAMEPHEPVIAFNLSHVLRQLGEPEEARRYLTKALVLDPNFAEAWYNLASLAREADDIDSARRHLRRAITADPRYPDPLYNLALLEFEAGEYDEAAHLWQRYLKLDPNSAWGKKARHGLQLINMMNSAQRSGSALGDTAPIRSAPTA